MPLPTLVPEPPRNVFHTRAGSISGGRAGAASAPPGAAAEAIAKTVAARTHRQLTHTIRFGMGISLSRITLHPLDGQSCTNPREAASPCSPRPSSLARPAAPQREAGDELLRPRLLES